MPKHFQKVKEDFTCDHCGTKVIGNGFTNHCPNCLYSKHVDEKFPGDRLSGCLGSMKPFSLEAKGDRYIILHQCAKCGKVTRNRSEKNDNPELLISLSVKLK